MDELDTGDDKDNIASLRIRASKLMAKQEWEAALEMAKAYASAHAEQAKPWTVVADIAVKARDKGGATARKYNDEAIAAATQIISLQPYNANAYVKRGRMFFIDNDIVQAEQDFRLALECRPNYEAALYSLGSVAFMRDHWVEAETYYRESLKQQEDAAAYNALGMTLMRQGRPSEALQPLLTAVRLRPRRSKYRHTLANGLEALGRTEEARRIRERINSPKDTLDA